MGNNFNRIMKISNMQTGNGFNNARQQNANRPAYLWQWHWFREDIFKSRKNNNTNSEMKPYAYAKRYNLLVCWNNQNARSLKSDLIVYDAATNHNDNWNSIKQNSANRIAYSMLWQHFVAGFFTCVHLLLCCKHIENRKMIQGWKTFCFPSALEQLIKIYHK